MGLAAGNPTETILARAMAAMVVAWVVGRVLGGVAQKMVGQSIERYKKDHPIPGEQQSQSAAAPGGNASGAPQSAGAKQSV